MVRTGTGTIKIGPPLNIPDDALLEGISIIEESIKELTKEI
jgi:4-aminobutyrate aminotransferase-like enzyme